MKAFIENEIKFTKIKFDASTPGSKLYEEYKHWINAYEFLLESLPADKALVPIEPTEAMLLAGEYEIRNWSNLDRAYKAMLTAYTKEV